MWYLIAVVVTLDGEAQVSHAQSYVHGRYASLEQCQARRRSSGIERLQLTEQGAIVWLCRHSDAVLPIQGSPNINELAEDAAAQYRPDSR